MSQQYLPNNYAYQTIYGNDVMGLLNQSMKIALEEQDQNVSIQKVMEFWGKELQSDRTYIFELINGLYYNTYEWCKQGIRPEKEHLQAIPLEATQIWHMEFEEKGYAIVKNVEDIKESNPRLYEVLKPQQLTSVITCPIYHDGILIGFYGVDNPPEDKMDNLTSALPIIGSFLDSLVIRRNLMDELERESTQDFLTGLLNKRAMDKQIESRNKELPCAVIFCDICGLKKTNDTLGHSAGDRLILQTSKNIVTAFGSKYVYRIGGDEFVIIVYGTDIKTVQNKINRLRNYAYQTNAPIAIGYVHHKNSYDIYSMITEADNHMYEDKKLYYERHDNDRRN